MSDTYQIVFLKAGDGSPSSQKSVAERIAHATKSAPELMLKQIERAPFIYKKGLPKAKADSIAAVLNKLGATTEVRPEGATAGPAASPSAAGAPRPAPPVVSKPAPAADAFSFDADPGPQPRPAASSSASSG